MKEKVANEKKTSEGSKGGFWKVLGFLLVVLVLGVNSYLIWQMQSVVGRVDQYNQGVIDEIGGMKGDVKNFSADLNEIRKFLLLPEKQYSVSDDQAQLNQDSDQNSSDTVAMYAMLDAIAKDQKTTQNGDAAKPVLSALLTNVDFINGLVPANLSIGEKADLQVKFNDNLAKNADGSDNALKGQPLYNLVFDQEDNLFKLQSAIGEQQFKDFNNAGFVSQVQTYLTQNVVAVREKKLANLNAESQAKVQAEQQAKQNLENQKKQLADVLHEAAFQDGLKAMGWKVVDQARDENNKYVFDIVDPQNKVQFSVALEISTGMTKLIRNGQEIDIKNFLDTDGSKKKS